MPRTALGCWLLIVLAACSASDATSSTAANLEDGERIYARHCAGCHGDDGRGIVGPGLDRVLETFPDCNEQLRWIEFGSDRWRLEVGPVYGARELQIEGMMPSFAEVLEADEIRAVAGYERVEFGNENPGLAAAGCGLVPEEPAG